MTGWLIEITTAARDRYRGHGQRFWPMSLVEGGRLQALLIAAAVWLVRRRAGCVGTSNSMTQVHEEYCG